MSKIGKKPILVPSGVNISIKGNIINVQGAKGSLSLNIPQGIDVHQVKDQIKVSRKNDEKSTRALHGTIRQLIVNMVAGVEKEWFKKLKIVGTGYVAVLEGDKLNLSLGMSHPVLVEPVKGIHFEVNKDIITVMGSDKGLVGKVAAEIRSLRPPDAYKGKGVRYADEVISLKPGKAAKVGEGAGAS